jgi:tRNA(Ile)-lysidine synthase
MAVPLSLRFSHFVRAKRLVATGDHVLVAASGGIDSIVLLHLFKECATTLGIKLTAAHFDHAMRDASAADAEWLAGLCEAWQIPLITKRSADALYGEAAARSARYAFLSEAMRSADAQRIATAHHADDQIETVIFRLLRGTGLRGLAGIPLRRGPIIRPLLRFHKTELLEYAAQHQLGFREDESNTTDVYARNRIRRAVIPVLQTVRPTAPHAILTLARYAARTERAWQSLLKNVQRDVFLSTKTDAVELARDKLLEYDAEIRARVLRGVWRRFGSVPDQRATRDALRFLQAGGSGSRYQLAGGVQMQRAYDVVRITRVAPTTEQRAAQIDGCDDGWAEAVIGGRSWQVRWTTSPENNSGERFACAALKFPLAVRSWQPGDRMRMNYGTKKLKKLFAEQRVPFNNRAQLPVIVDCEGYVLWVPGVARSIEAQPEGKTAALTIMVTNAEIS